MSPTKELGFMSPEEATRRNLKVSNALQWVWRGMVIVILIFQIVNLLLFAVAYNGWQASQKAQNKAIAYLVDVTVDKSTIDPKTNEATPWIVEIYQKLVGVIHADEETRDRMVAQMQDYTRLGEARQKKNEELVSQQKNDQDAFIKTFESDLAGERDDRNSWAKAVLDALQRVKMKVDQKIINPADVAPVYRQNRVLQKQNRKLKEQKKPVVKIWPWQ